MTTPQVKPLRVGLFTWGSEGDVRPFVALGAALAARGHQVDLSYVLVNGTDLAPLCAQHGMRSRFVARETTARALANPGDHARALTGNQSPLKQVQSVLSGLLDPATREMWEDARQHIGQYDVAVTHILHHPAATAALAAGVPLVHVLPAPMLPTREMPPIGAPNLGALNPLLWRLADWLAGTWFLPRVNALRKEANLRPLTRMYPNPNPELALSLTCVSPTLVPQPADWLPTHRVVGFFDLPTQGMHIPPEVDAFLAAGDPPVLMTFGSMLAHASAESEAVIAAMHTAAEKLGTRVIVQAPDYARAHLASSPSVCVAGALPHALVMPRCALVVHHGGAGTTQAACKAGTPSVVVPFMADQFFWAQRLRALGVAGAPVPRSRLTARQLVSAMKESMALPQRKQAAQALAAQLQSANESGVMFAAPLVEAVALQQTSTPGA